MERANYFSDQLVLSGDLNFTELSKASQSIYRSQAPLGYSGGFGVGNATASVYKGGVFGSPADYLNTAVNFYPSASTATTLTIAPGTAMDVYGEMVRMSTSKVLSLGGSDSEYSWPSTPSALHYIKLRYAETAQTYKADDVGTSFPTRYVAGVFFLVDTAVPAAQELLLGVFVSDGSGQITTIADKRTYATTITPASVVILDPLDKPVAAWTSVEDHVQALGTGTPAQTNPHGLSVLDLANGSDALTHRKYQHTPGIYFINSTRNFGPTTTPAYTASVVSGISGFDEVDFGLPQGTVIVAGNALITSALSALSTNTAPYDGVYDIIVDSTGVASWFTASLGPLFYSDPLEPHRDPNYVWLAQAIITGTTPGAHDRIEAGNLSDKRQFFTLTQPDIRADYVEAASSAGLTQASTVLENLDRIRNSIGLLNTGVGNSWNTPVGNIQYVSASLQAEVATIVSGSAPIGGEIPQTLLGSSGSIKALFNQFSHMVPHFDFYGYAKNLNDRNINIAYQNTTGRTEYHLVTLLVFGTTGYGITSGWNAEFRVNPVSDDLTGTSATSSVFVPSSWYCGPAFGWPGTGSVYLEQTLHAFVPPGAWYKIKTVEYGDFSVSRVGWTAYN